MSEEESVFNEQGIESFESLYEKLMVVVERLEVGGLSLEESIGLYDEGARLNSACKSLLDAASARLEMSSQE